MPCTSHEPHIPVVLSKFLFRHVFLCSSTVLLSLKSFSFFISKATSLATLFRQIPSLIALKIFLDFPLTRFISLLSNLFLFLYLFIQSDFFSLTFPRVLCIAGFQRSVLGGTLGIYLKSMSLNCDVAVTVFVNKDVTPTVSCSALLYGSEDDVWDTLLRHMHKFPITVTTAAATFLSAERTSYKRRRLMPILASLKPLIACLIPIQISIPLMVRYAKFRK